MEDLNTEGKKENNVISLFGAKTQPEAAKQAKSSQPETEVEANDEVLFEEAMRRNEENRRRMMKERNKGNKGVLKSYRIKH